MQVVKGLENVVRLPSRVHYCSSAPSRSLGFTRYTFQNRVRVFYHTGQDCRISDLESRPSPSGGKSRTIILAVDDSAVGNNMEPCFFLLPNQSSNNCDYSKTITHSYACYAVNM